MAVHPQAVVAGSVEAWPPKGATPTHLDENIIQKGDGPASVSSRHPGVGALRSWHGDGERPDLASTLSGDGRPQGWLCGRDPSCCKERSHGGCVAKRCGKASRGLRDFFLRRSGDEKHPAQLPVSRYEVSPLLHL